MKFEYNGQSFELIMLTVTGSRMYGNATEKSDWDYRGIYIESLENKLGIKDSIEQLGGANKQGITYKLDKSGNKIYNIQGREIYEILKANGLNLNETDDIELYELNRFTKLALDNNPNILDLLCHNTKNSIYLNEIGKELLDNKDLFLSQKLRHTFSGYALSQLKRIKSHNKWIEEFPDTHKVISYLSLAYAKNKIDFNWITDNFGGQVAEQITQETPQKNRKVPNDLKWSWEDFLQFNQTGVNLNKYRLPRLTDFCYPKDLNGKKLSMTDKKYSIIGEFYYTEDSEEHPKMFSLKEILEKNASFRTFSPSMLSIYTNGNGIFTKEGNLRPNDPEKIGDFICLLSIDQMKYKSTKDHISKMWNWKCNRNEQRSAMEEAFGYDCYLNSKTLFLTENGWKKYYDITEVDKLATVNPITKNLEFQNFVERIDKDFTGEINVLETHNTKCYVTNNHRMFISDVHRSKSNNFSSIYNEDNSNWHYSSMENLLNSNKSYYHILRRFNNNNKDYNISDELLIIIGMYVSEGSLLKSDNKKTIKGVSISQLTSNDNFNKYPRGIKDYKIIEYKHKRKNKYESTFNIYNSKLGKLLLEYCGEYSNNKKLPNFISQLSERQASLLLNVMLAGDGSNRKFSDVYYTSSIQLTKDTMFLGLMANKITKIWNYIEKHSCNQVYIAGKEKFEVLNTSKHVNKISVVDDKIVCFTVLNENLITMADGKVSIQGNTKHASHLVRLMSACKEILLNNQYIPELNGDRLQIVKDVRNGKYSYEWLIDYSEKEDKKLDEYLKVSTLQEKPNYEAIHNLLITLQEKSLDIKIDRDFN